MSKKIAICFSGHLRQFFDGPELECFKQNIDLLKSQGHTVDLFFSIWNTYNTKTNSHGGEETPIDDSIFSQLDITLLEIQNYSTLKEMFKLRNFHPTIEPEIDAVISSDGVLHNTPMFYKIHRANLLKTLHETKHNFKYDVVVRYRANIHLTDAFNFYDVEPGYLYVEGRGHSGMPRECRGLGLTELSWMMQDIFFYGDSSTMDIVCDVYNNLTAMYPKYGSTGPERIFYDWVVLENKIPTKHHAIGFSLK